MPSNSNNSEAIAAVPPIVEMPSISGIPENDMIYGKYTTAN